MARTKNSINKFAAPAQQYVGRMGVMEGPPGGPHLVVSTRPLTRDKRDRPLGAEGKDLRPERPQRQTEPPKALKKKQPK